MAKQRTIFFRGDFCPSDPHVLHSLLSYLNRAKERAKEDVDKILISIASAEGHVIPTTFGGDQEAFEKVGGRYRRFLFIKMMGIMSEVYPNLKDLIEKIDLLPEGHDHRENAAGEVNAKTALSVDPDKQCSLLRKYNQKYNNLMYVFGEKEAPDATLPASDYEAVLTEKLHVYAKAGSGCLMRVFDQYRYWSRITPAEIHAFMHNDKARIDEFDETLSSEGPFVEYWKFLKDQAANNFKDCTQDSAPKQAVPPKAAQILVEKEIRISSSVGGSVDPKEKRAFIREFSAWCTAIFLGVAGVITSVCAGVLANTPSYLSYLFPLALALVAVTAMTMVWGSFETSARQRSLLFSKSGCLGSKGEAKSAPKSL